MCDHPYVPWCYHSQTSIEFHTVLSRRRCDSTTFYRRTSAIANENNSGCPDKNYIASKRVFQPRLDCSPERRRRHDQITLFNVSRTPFLSTTLPSKYISTVLRRPPNSTHKMDIESAVKALEDLSAQPDQAKQLSPDLRQRILSLGKELPGLFLIPEQLAFMQIFEVTSHFNITYHVQVSADALTLD